MQRCFSDLERDDLALVAQTTIPAHGPLAAADAQTIARLEKFLASSPRAMQRGYSTLLKTLNVAARLRYGRPFRRLGAKAQRQLLESWRSGDYARRTALRALLTPIKASYCDDPALYARLGCVYGTPNAGEARERYFDRVQDAGEIGDYEVVDCDAVVIGTGAGGAVTAYELAEQGHAVVLLEEGQYFTRKDFNGHSIQMQKKLWRDMGATISVGNVGIPIPIGKSVGGTTTINSGTCYRVPNRVLEKWQDRFGLADITADSLAPRYEKLEQVLGIGPNPPQYLGNIAKMIARGCDVLGYEHLPLKRNAPDCDGQGVCCFGCPTDAKRSMNVSYVPMALKAGAQLFTNARAEKILIENGRAVGVVAFTEGRRRLTVRARAVVVAAGTLLSPVLLMANGLCGQSGQLGKNLSIHPALASWAFFDEKIEGYRGVPQGYAIESFRDQGLLFEGGFTPLDIGGPSFSMIGEAWTRIVADYDRIACFGFMIEDTSRGRVFKGPGLRPLISYFLNAHDVARLKHGAEILARVYFAAGAKEIIPSIHGFDSIASERDLDRLRRAHLTARDFDLTAYHPLGTCRMGVDPNASVVGPDHQAHDVKGLYVTDGSAVPSSLAVNPQLTIMALSMRASEYIGKALAAS